MDYRRLLLAIILVISLVVYIGALGWTYYESLTTDGVPSIKQGILDIITGFGAVLAMNLGAFLGIKGRFSPAAAEDPHEKLRFWAGLIYIIALLASSIVWVIEGMDSTTTLPIFEEMFGALLGTLFGGVTVALGWK
jgi:hypothetical protein